MGVACVVIETRLRGVGYARLDTTPDRPTLLLNGNTARAAKTPRAAIVSDGDLFTRRGLRVERKVTAAS